MAILRINELPIANSVKDTDLMLLETKTGTMSATMGKIKEVLSETNKNQSDWNQSDENAPDYIKNRPFYEDLVGARVFIAEHEFTASGGNTISVEADGYINNSKTYVAIFDGVSHICELRYDDPDFSATFSHNGYLIATDGWNLWLPIELEGDHVIEVLECDSADIKELDEHFIPQTIARDALKLDKLDPVGKGSISIGRKEDSITGTNSQAFGEGVVAEGAWQFTQGKYNIKSYIYAINQYRGTVSLYSSHLHLCGSNYTFDEINGTYTLTDEREEFPGNIPIGSYFFENRYDSRRNVIYYRDSDTIVEQVDNITKRFTNVLVLDRIYAPFSGGKYAHIVGNGTSDDNRSNAHTLDWEGNAWFQGTIKVGGTSQDDTSAKEVALKEDIPDISNLALKTEIPNVDSYITTHNTSTTAHNDIRDLITGLTNRLNALADSDDTTLDQLSEIVTYIKSNKELIDAITTSKVNVNDIVNNLTTNVSNKPLSAAQGVALKSLIDAITVPTKVSELTNDSGYLTSYTETDPTVPAWAKAASKPTYTATEVGADATGTASSAVSTHNTSTDAHNDIREELANKMNQGDNADSATKLQTARTINGIAFDGTADIVVPSSVKIGTITLTADGWVEDATLGAFKQTAAIPNLANGHKVDLDADLNTINQLPASIVPYNMDGTFYAVTLTPPSVDIAVQYTLLATN